jgi:hypothetical protein
VDASGTSNTTTTLSSTVSLDAMVSTLQANSAAVKSSNVSRIHIISLSRRNFEPLVPVLAVNVVVDVVDDAAIASGGSFVAVVVVAILAVILLLFSSDIDDDGLVASKLLKAKDAVRILVGRFGIRLDGDAGVSENDSFGNQRLVTDANLLFAGRSVPSLKFVRRTEFCNGNDHATTDVDGVVGARPMIEPSSVGESWYRCSVRNTATVATTETYKNRILVDFISY